MSNSKCSKQLCILSMSLIILFAFSSVNAAQEQVFYADFEDGLTASTGRITTIANVTVVQDLVEENNSVKVGTPAPDPNAGLSYFIGMNKIGKDGEINLKFKIPSDYNTTKLTSGVIKLIGVKYDSFDHFFWDIQLSKRNEMVLRNLNIKGILQDGTGPGYENVQDTITLPDRLTDGWHALKFTWVETLAQNSLYPDLPNRCRANLAISIDGVEVFNKPDAWWAFPGGCIVSVGSYIQSLSGVLSGANPAGKFGILIDDVNVVCESVPDLTPELGKGTVVWSYDAEDGFNASSGMPYAYDTTVGAITNPLDTSGPIYTVFDADKGSQVVKVGNKTPDNGAATGAYLNWSNLDMGVFPVNGRVKLAFMIPSTWVNQARCMLFESKFDRLLNNHNLAFGLLNRGMPYIRSHNGSGSPSTTTYTLSTGTTPCDHRLLLADGWHTCEFTWELLTPQRDTAARANLRMYFDGYLAYEGQNVQWVVPEISNISIGSWWGFGNPPNDSVLSTYFEAGDLGVLIDDVVVEAIPFECGDEGTVYLDGDLNEDCTVSFADVDIYAEGWLGCTNPLEVGCTKESLDLAQVMNYDAPQSSSVVVNGDLSEWSDAVWADIPYYTAHQVAASKTSNPCGRNEATDMPSAMYAVKWNEADNKLYVAVKVVDTQHNFKAYSVEDANVYDRIDLHVQGTNAGGAIVSANYNAGQIYTIGRDSSGSTWVTLGHTDVNPDAIQGVSAATSLNGDEIIYEVAVIPYDVFEGRISGTVTPTDLINNKVVKLDVICASRYSMADVCSYGLLGDNKKYLKFNLADGWNTVTCKQTLPTTCGSWGYESADIDKNCKVDFKDLAKFGSTWSQCTNPTDAGCDPYWP